ncbi:MAG: stage 0 sporulation protein [Thermoflexales bacterium]|nr:stage 0 sporulation protein [Thermoflexales bacterium]
MADKNSPTRLVGVRFYPIGKTYHFDASGWPNLKQGDFVIVETARGRQMGQVTVLDPPSSDNTPGSVKPIESIATGRDMAIRCHWQGKEAEALEICQQAARHLNLPIKVIKAEYSFDGTRLLFLYTAENKIDTHKLKQEITPSFRARIEFKLVGPRDAAKSLGGYGACGELRCCQRFLTSFSSISIKMAKEQEINLNPQEITGVCGRLRCCLAYEYEQYVEARKGLPKRGKEIGTSKGRGVVTEVLPLKGAVMVRVDELHFEVAREDILPLEGSTQTAPQAATPQPSSTLASRRGRKRRRKKTGGSSRMDAHHEQKKVNQGRQASKPKTHASPTDSRSS